MHCIKKRFIKGVLCFGFFLSSTQFATAQVTIGSLAPPVSGALLDLKDDNLDKDTHGGITAKKGLGLPRVELKDLTQLTMGGNVIVDAPTHSNASTIWKDHTGLVVYHASQCTLNGAGVYVWTGSQWTKIGKSNPSRLMLDKTYFDLPSGHDARGAVAGQTLTATWGGTTAPSWALVASGGLAAVDLSTPSTTIGTIGTSPYSMVITPTPMPTPDATTPWMSQQSTLTFTDHECGGQIPVTLNQTHYALKANNVFGNSQIVYTTLARASTFNVQGNGVWKTAKSDPNNILASTTPAIGTESGQDLKDGSIPPIQTFSYAPRAGSKYYTADIIFQDTESPNRFKDVTVSILNCDLDTDPTRYNNDPTLEEWALRAGFSQTDIDAVKNDASGATNKGPLANGIMLHRDQDGNIFLSGRFGYEDIAKTIERRWMLNNLIATTYVTELVGRTGDDKKIHIAMPTTASGARDFAAPSWAYPHISAALTGDGDPTNPNIFSNNKRLGLLYNWAAATNSKGRYALDGTELDVGGVVRINDGEVAAKPDTDPQTAKIQGICPNGWHLPSDREWTYLEQEINTNTSNYSSVADVNGTITIEAINERGTHGVGLKDLCPTFGQERYLFTYGASNIISHKSMVSPGLNILFAGSCSQDLVRDYGRSGYLWSSSGSGSHYAWGRGIRWSQTGVVRHGTYRDGQKSVRCKKD